MKNPKKENSNTSFLHLRNKDKIKGTKNRNKKIKHVK